MSPANPASPAAHQSVLRMAAPLVVSFWMRSLFTFVDTIYAATLGDASVAAIGLSIPFEFLMIAIWVGLSNSLTSHLARAMGAGEGEKIRQYLRSSWVMVLAMSPCSRPSARPAGSSRAGSRRRGRSPASSRSTARS